MSNAGDIRRTASGRRSNASRGNGRRSPPSACCWCVLGFAALVFSLVATIATVTLNGVLFLIAGAAEIAIGMHSRGLGARFFSG